MFKPLLVRSSVTAVKGSFLRVATSVARVRSFASPALPSKDLRQQTRFEEFEQAFFPVVYVLFLAVGAGFEVLAELGDGSS